MKFSVAITIHITFQREHECGDMSSEEDIERAATSMKESLK